MRQYPPRPRPTVTDNPIALRRWRNIPGDPASSSLRELSAKSPVSRVDPVEGDSVDISNPSREESPPSAMMMSTCMTPNTNNSPAAAGEDSPLSASAMMMSTCMTRNTANSSSSSRGMPERMRAMLAAPGNKRCADCDVLNPRWASYSLGVFICPRCAGAHRSLGTHVSRVKSTDLDSWTDEQLTRMESLGGNEKALLEYGPSYAVIKGTSDQPEMGLLNLFIRNKYVNLMFAPDKSKTLAGEQRRVVASTPSAFGVLGSYLHATSGRSSTSPPAIGSSPNGMANSSSSTLIDFSSPPAETMEVSYGEGGSPSADFGDFVIAPKTVQSPVKAAKKALPVSGPLADFFGEMSVAGGEQSKADEIPNATGLYSILALPPSISRPLTIDAFVPRIPPPSTPSTTTARPSFSPSTAPPPPSTGNVLDLLSVDLGAPLPAATPASTDTPLSPTFAPSPQVGMPSVPRYSNDDILSLYTNGGGGGGGRPPAQDPRAWAAAPQPLLRPGMAPAAWQGYGISPMGYAAPMPPPPPPPAKEKSPFDDL